MPAASSRHRQRRLRQLLWFQRLLASYSKPLLVSPLPHPPALRKAVAPPRCSPPAPLLAWSAGPHLQGSLPSLEVPNRASSWFLTRRQRVMHTSSRSSVCSPCPPVASGFLLLLSPPPSCLSRIGRPGSAPLPSLQVRVCPRPRRAPWAPWRPPEVASLSHDHHPSSSAEPHPHLHPALSSHPGANRHLPWPARRRGGC